MLLQAGQGGMRVDCIRLAKCKHYSLYFCRMHCDWWNRCDSLSKRAKAIRTRLKTAEAAKEKT